MKRELLRTSDGSVTFHLPDWNETYHSKFGAIQEARHVFIENGLYLFEPKVLSILEIGFGTGLNAFITFLESVKNGGFSIDYSAVEAYPITPDEVRTLNYVEELQATAFAAEFEKMHESDWEKSFSLSPDFIFGKYKMMFQDICWRDKFDLIYFDAFGYRVQPELWSGIIFEKMYASLKHNGILVTYAARSVIKRNMQAAGFRVEKVPGPIGKREMFRAYK